MNVISHRSNTANIVNLRKVFDQFDFVISSEEFKVALSDKCSYTDAMINEMLNSVDINHNRHIMYTEFIAVTLEAQGQLDEDRVAEAFHRLDGRQRMRLERNLVGTFGQYQYESIRRRTDDPRREYGSLWTG